MTYRLNPSQESAASAPLGPLLIVAGAGTGKTLTLTNRLIRFTEKGVEPAKICAITFTNKAASEMTERLRNSKFETQNLKSRPFIGTFHALGARILRKEGWLLGRRSNFVIFDDGDSFGLVKKIAKGIAGKDEKGGPAPAFFAQKISEIKNAALVLKELRQSRKPEDKLALFVFGRYESALKRNNAFDFDDLIEKVVYLFKKYPEVLQKYQKKFDAVLVDEYQDLNPKQYELLKLLARRHKNLSVVGDDEQMIYGWRYANIATFLNFEKDWPKALVALLEENYRSTANIISAASAVAQNNQHRRPKNLWTRNPAGQLIKLAEAADEDEEAEWIANQILSSESPPSPGFGRAGETRNSTAVLYRTNAQSRALEQAFIRRRIPYQIFGGVKFYERKEIKDILAALRLALNRSDELSRERLEKGLGQRRLKELKEGFLNEKSRAPLRLIDVFLKTTDYLAFLEKNFMNHAERRENIGELVNFAARFDEIQPFLEEIALVQSTDGISSLKSRYAAEKNFGSVNLMTIHLSKGLEFDKVFIAGCREGLLPHSMSLDNEYELEEERRLMYVAMTRAKQELNISFYNLPSRFIGEIPNEYIKLEHQNNFDAQDENWNERCVNID